MYIQYRFLLYLGGGGNLGDYTCQSSGSAAAKKTRGGRKKAAGVAVARAKPTHQ